MQKRKKLICILLGALMLMGALSGCAPEATPEGERFVLRVSVCGRIPSLDPAMNTDEKAQSAFCALYENLMRMADDGTGRAAAAPGVAKEYKAVENFDGTVDYAFTLRSSARWSDGTRVRARDFVYAWRRLVDPETDSPNHALLSMVSGYDTVRETGDITALAVKAENDTTFRVTLSAPCAYFLTEVCTAVATMPVRGDLIRDDPDWAERAAVVGNGAYRVGVWAKNEYLQLRRSPSYHDSRAAVPDTLRFVFSGGGDEARRLYESGRVDYAASPPGAAAASAAVPLRATACLLYNHMSDVFSNEHARRAFDLALDRAALAAAAGAAAAPATGYVPYGVESEITDFRAAGGELCAVDEAGYAARCLEAERELRLAGYRGGQGLPRRDLSLRCGRGERGRRGGRGGDVERASQRLGGDGGRLARGIRPTRRRRRVRPRGGHNPHALRRRDELSGALFRHGREQPPPLREHALRPSDRRRGVDARRGGAHGVPARRGGAAARRRGALAALL